MSLPALKLLEKKFEQQKRIFELKKGALEKKIEQHLAFFDERKDAIEKKIEQRLESQKKKLETRFRRLDQNKGIGLDDEVRFIRTWLEKPLTTGAVTPS